MYQNLVVSQIFGLRKKEIRYFWMAVMIQEVGWWITPTHDILYKHLSSMNSLHKGVGICERWRHDCCVTWSLNRCMLSPLSMFKSMVYAKLQCYNAKLSTTTDINWNTAASYKYKTPIYTICLDMPRRQMRGRLVTSLGIPCICCRIKDIYGRWDAENGWWGWSVS